MSDAVLAALPEPIAAIIGSATASPIATGMSADRVTRLDGSTSSWVLKQGVDLSDEVDRLRWLDGRAGAPTVEACVSDEAGDHLLMSAIAGVTAIDPLARMDSERSLAAVGHGLRALHDLPVDGCPFDRRRETLLALARERVAAGAVVLEDLEPAHRRYTPAEFLAHIETAMPDEPEDLVVAHGDYCLPNVLVDQGRFAGMIDVGRLGVGDRVLDLGLCVRSILRNYGPEAVPVVLDAYGPPTPSARLVDFHVLLDQLL